MNERIQELAVQAGFTGWTQQTTIGLELEKFAELIVKECSAVANHFSDGHEVREFDDSKRYLYFVDIGKVLLEHFGVEE